VGGCAAQAVATRLAETGTAPLGVALIDTYRVTEENENEEWLAGLPFRQADDTALATMGAYVRIMRGWRPRSAAVPTVLLRAEDLGKRAEWPPPVEVVDVPGNHFGLLTDHVDTTASALGQWLSRSEKPHVSTFFDTPS
jgi:hypothetical protein